MEETLPATKLRTTVGNGWSLTEQEMDAALQLVQLSGDSSHSVTDFDDVTAAIARKVKEEGGEDSHTDSTADVSSPFVIKKNAQIEEKSRSFPRIRKRKLRTVEDLYRATAPSFEKLLKKKRNFKGV